MPGELQCKMSDDYTTEGEIIETMPVLTDAKARAEIDMAISTARRYPRNVARFKDELLSLATLDQETAEGCFFSLSRSGKTIQGPSIRLAEIALSCWGNLRAGSRITGETEDGRFVRAEAAVHDLEKNVTVTIETQRRITNKDNRRYNDDMITQTANAAVSIALRNAVFRVVPQAFIRPAYAKAKEVALGKAKSLGDRRREVLDRLRVLHPTITDERVLAVMGRPSVDQLTADDLVHLIGLGTALKDGETTVEESFPAPSETIKADDIIGRKGKGSKFLTDRQKVAIRGYAAKVGLKEADADAAAAMVADGLDLDSCPAEHEAAILGELKNMSEVAE